MKNIKEKLRDIARRKLARTLLPLSTLRTRMILRKSEGLKILVDSSVLGHGITHETAWVSTGTSMWGSQEIATGYLAQIPVHSPDNQERVYNEVKYLAGIAYLAQQNYFRLFTSSELRAEQSRQPTGRFCGYGWYDMDVFEHTNFQSVDEPRVDIFDTAAGQFERISRTSEPLYKSLLSLLGSKSSLDAFHIFTAEKYKLDYFLHIDFPLATKIAQNSHRNPISSLSVKIVTPSQLAKELQLFPIQTNLLALIEQKFPSRPDLHQINQRRRRASSK